MSVLLGFVVGVLAVRLFVGAGRELCETRHPGGLERGAAAERIERNVGTTVGNEHHVFHGDG